MLGSFGIRVIRGEVNVAGASFRATEAVHWVHAPSCHAIPVLRCAEKTGLELYPDPCARSLRQLGRLSPLFRKMWNEPTNSTNKRPISEATFQIVSPKLRFQQIAPLTVYSCTLPRMHQRALSSKTWCRLRNGTRSSPLSSQRRARSQTSQP